MFPVSKGPHGDCCADILPPMSEQGLQFRPNLGGFAAATALTLGSVAVSVTAGLVAVRGADQRPAALGICAFFALGTAFGVASLHELVTRKPMHRGVTCAVGTGLAAILAIASLAPGACSLGIAPLLRVVLAAVSLALVVQAVHAWRRA